MKKTLLRSTTITYLSIIVITLAGLIASEILISSLHDIKNNITPKIFTTLTNMNFLQRDLKQEAPIRTSSVDSFPFRSSTPEEPFNKNIIWISSASHGEDLSYSMSEVFPNLICAYLNSTQESTCLNHSKAGWTISDNIKGLKDFGQQWEPNFVILYQMSLDIQRMAGKQFDDSNNINSPIIRQPFSNRMKDYILKKIESTTIYKDIREFIGSSLLIAAPLPNSLPKEANNEYSTLLNDFVAETARLGAKPILTTFAFSHAAEDWDSVPFRTKTWIMLWQTDLSPLGFIQTIELYNEFIRKFSRQHDILLVDLEATIGGKPEYFRDPVHFNKKGHDKIAQLVAGIISNVEAVEP